VYFINEANQTEKVFDPEKRATCGDGDERILYPDVSPVKRHRGSTPFRINEKNATLICKSPDTIDFKLDVAIWMKRVGNLEGCVGKVFIGCS
jgi:hypothetical protein